MILYAAQTMWPSGTQAGDGWRLQPLEGRCALDNSPIKLGRPIDLLLNAVEPIVHEGL